MYYKFAGSPNSKLLCCNAAIRRVGGGALTNGPNLLLTWLAPRNGASAPERNGAGLLCATEVYWARNSATSTKSTKALIPPSARNSATSISSVSSGPNVYPGYALNTHLKPRR